MNQEMQTTETKAPLIAGYGVTAIVPQDAEQAFRMAKMILMSGLAPRDMDTAEKVVGAIFTGLEVGLKPMQAVQSIAMINGRPCIWGDAAIGLVRGSGLLENFEERYDDEKGVAVCFAWRVGQKAVTSSIFSVEDAKKAGLWGKKGPWTQYPKRMLQMRARGFALRDGFADVLKGLQIVEEVRDYQFTKVASGAEPAPQITADDIAKQADRQLNREGDHFVLPGPATNSTPPLEPEEQRAIDGEQTTELPLDLVGPVPLPSLEEWVERLSGIHNTDEIENLAMYYNAQLNEIDEESRKPYFVAAVDREHEIAGALKD